MQKKFSLKKKLKKQFLSINDSIESYFNNLKSIKSYLKKSRIIKQVKDQGDSRRKLLYLDHIGKKFYNEIFESQKKRIFNALKDSDPGSVIKFKEVLKKIINGKK